MRNQILVTFITLLFAIPTNAQCPSSSRANIHVVQSGQTLYSIAKMYGTSVANLSRVNRLTDNTMISVCSELQIASMEFTARSVQTQQNRRPAAPTSYEATSYTTKTYVPQANASTSYASRLAASRGTHIVSAGESLQSIANHYGYTPERMIEMNSLANNYQPNPGAVLVVSECYFTEGYTGEMGKLGDDKVLDLRQTNTQTNKTNSPIAEPQNNRNRPTTNTNSVSPAAATYMKSEELSMMDEVNLVRSNPAGYIPYIEDYKAKILRGEGFGSAAVCDELIAELRVTPALSILKPRECLYRAAKNHGEDQRPTGSVDHKGTDGSYPWDRVLRGCPELTDGNENLVGGPSTVRESVIILLIDDGIPSRGHRKTMLQKEWQYLACYKIGKVGMMPNSWVQKFAY